MKTKLPFAMLFIAFIGISCSTPNYYQLYKTAPQASSSSNDGLVYEDSNCIVTYNLWSEKGNAGFKFYNKTNENIYINLSDSYFVMNGIAYDYFKNRVVTESNGQTLSQTKKTTITVPVSNNFFWPLVGSQSTSSASSTSGYAVAYTESKIATIPPKTAKVFSEYLINQQLVKDCNLLKYPSKKQVKTISFNSEDSPLVFSNRIAYNVGTGNTVKFENAFYVTEISNHPYNDFVMRERTKECGETVTLNTFNHKAANSFYITYSKGNDVSKY